MSQSIEATISYEERLFPPGTSDVSTYRIDLLDSEGNSKASKILASPQEIVVFSSLTPDTYLVRAVQRDASGIQIGEPVFSDSVEIQADVTLIVVSGVSLKVLSG